MSANQPPTGSLTIIEPLLVSKSLSTWSLFGCHLYCLPELPPPPARSLLNLYLQYVRREIRALHDEDRELFLDVLEILYRVPTSEGKKIYGEDYKVGKGTGDGKRGAFTEDQFSFAFGQMVPISLESSGREITRLIKIYRFLFKANTRAIFFRGDPIPVANGERCPLGSRDGSS